ncbi:hypothetical protein IFR05_014408 [Cadophora sp. M221]|nr:hypothetical protein IFR05_014408 [Cadophora sp. M221]
MARFTSSANNNIAYTFQLGVFAHKFSPELLLVVGKAVVGVTVGVPGRFGFVTAGVDDLGLDEAPSPVVDGELEGMKGICDGNGSPISDVRSTGGRVDCSITPSQRSISEPNTRPS